jgi:hypothetical protein
MTANQFISKAVCELLEDGFSLRLPMTRSIDGKYGGWFSGETKQKEFVVAMKRDCAFEIFVHEYCHYLQWKERPEFYNTKAKGCDVVFSWLEGTDYSDRVLAKAFANVIELEWDCERTVLQLVKRYKLPIDVEKYIRGANCYLFFYHTVHETRAWTSKNRSPYSPRFRTLAQKVLHPFEYYLDTANYDGKLRRGHQKICST